MPRTRSLAVVTALAFAIAVAHDARGQGAKSGGTNQLATQDAPGAEGAKVNKIDALTIKQGAAAEKTGNAAIKGESGAAIKGEDHRRGIKGESGLAHKDAAAIKGESKDGTTGILIGLTPKPEADASMAGDASNAAARKPTMDQQQKAAGVIAPIDHKAGVGVIAPIDNKAAIAPSAGIGPAATRSPTVQMTPLPAQTGLPAVQAPAIKQAAPALPPGGAFGGSALPGGIKK